MTAPVAIQWVPPPAVEQWRDLVRVSLASIWPELPDGETWVLSQIEQESQGDPAACSKVGARGLLQLMPGTAAELGVRDVCDPASNVQAAIRYLREQYVHLSEIPTQRDRLRWALASYNGGRGFVNAALAIARARKDAAWWSWDNSSRYLASPACTVLRDFRHPALGTVRPDAAQMIGYVDRIEARVVSALNAPNGGAA